MNKLKSDKEILKNENYTFNEDLIVNKHDLDSELEKIANTCEKYGELLSIIEKTKDITTLELDVYSAKLDQEIRLENKNEKITETAIKNKIISDEKRIILTKKLIDLNTQCKVLKSFCASLDKKYKNIHYLCDLWGKDYYKTNFVKVKEKNNNTFSNKIRKNLK